MMLVGVALLVVGGLTVWRVARGDRRYRAGPWPGLSPAGGMVLLGCALLLAGGQLVVGDPRSPLPDVPLLGVLALLPMALATRLVGAPGAASAVCGAYLLPRALFSLADPSIEPPPLLLVPALAFDASAWLRASDLGYLPRVTGGVTRGVTRRSYAGGRRRGLVGPRRWGRGRGVLAGAMFGGVLAAVEPAYAVLLGADHAAWYGTNLWVAGGLTTLGCAMAGLAASGRDTAA
jgi:hypothetical protein